MSGTVGRKRNSNVRGKIMFWVRAAGTWSNIIEERSNKQNEKVLI
jgi:hypothetical protein